MNPSSLNTLELLGLISARLGHALSNHLSIITGNICVIGATRDDPDKAGAALQAALTAANSAGSLLARFTDLRRTIKDEAGSTSADDLHFLMQRWSMEHGWTLDLHAKWPPAQDAALPISWRWLSFILEAIVQASGARTGLIRLMPAQRLANPLLSSFQPIAWMQIALTWEGSRAIDWNSVRANLADFQLAAAWELLSQIGASPEHEASGDASQRTSLIIPLVAAA